MFFKTAIIFAEHDSLLNYFSVKNYRIKVHFLQLKVSYGLK